jgi:hypothetical protein
MAENSPTNSAWRLLVSRLGIERHLQDKGVFHLTADRIKRMTGREPRLMTKFDRRKSRPQILQDLGVTILPISNGEYALLKGDGYCAIPAPSQIEKYEAHNLAQFETIPWKQGVQSESQAIDALFTASAIRSFAGDKSLNLTIRGKLRSEPFSFTFLTASGPRRINTKGVQIEVDSGYEGESILILEAKYGSVEDLIARQIYYPYRHWLEKGVSKRILLAFLVYSNKVYSLYQFSFSDVESYHSLRLDRQKHYTLESIKPLPLFVDVLARSKKRAPGDIPFPQADDLSKVVDVVELLFSGSLDKSEIAEGFGVDPRQGDYYANAAAWLGLARKARGQFALTRDGRQFAQMDRSTRLGWLAERVSAMPVFYETAQAFAKGTAPNIEAIAELISKLPDLSGSTPRRRASTVRAWVEWIAGQLRRDA